MYENKNKKERMTQKENRQSPTKTSAIVNTVNNKNIDRKYEHILFFGASVSYACETSAKKKTRIMK